VKLVPIVSSARALKIICTKWQKAYQRIPDAVIVEGPQAGGHLGYSYQEVAEGTAMTLEQIIEEVLPVARSYNPPIPVIAAGGIFDGEDIARFLKLGASGVQMATRFVCTTECDVDEKFKQAYLDAKEEDVTIINSPVGLPGKVITNDFVTRIKAGQNLPYKCKYQCLKSCNAKEAPYCIAEVLDNASKGKLENAFVFAGSNVYRCREIVSVKSLMHSLAKEYSDAVKISV
jgi:NAD(P)H-dependent flavin oxidoreductase YrpB (nitropropane dioxygenase family)